MAMRFYFQHFWALHRIVEAAQAQGALDWDVECRKGGYKLTVIFHPRKAFRGMI